MEVEAKYTSGWESEGEDSMYRELGGGGQNTHMLPLQTCFVFYAVNNVV